MSNLFKSGLVLGVCLLSPTWAFAAIKEYHLNIDEKTKDRDLKTLLNTDIFRKYDGKIIRDLAQGLALKSILPAACREIINRRKTSHWF